MASPLVDQSDQRDQERPGRSDSESLDPRLSTGSERVSDSISGDENARPFGGVGPPRPMFDYPPGMWGPQFWGPPPPPGFPPMPWMHPAQATTGQTLDKRASESALDTEPESKRRCRPMYEPTISEEGQWELGPELKTHMAKFLKDLSPAEIKQLREDCPKPSEHFLRPRVLDQKMVSLLPRNVTDKAKDYDGMWKSAFVAAADVMGPLGRAWSDVHKGCEAAANGEDPECDMELVLTRLEQSAVLMAHLFYLIEQKRRLTSLRMFLKEPKAASRILRDAESTNNVWQDEKDDLFGKAFFTSHLKVEATEDKKSLGHQGQWNWGSKQGKFQKGPNSGNTTNTKQPFRKAPSGGKQFQWGEYGKFGRQWNADGTQKGQTSQSKAGGNKKFPAKGKSAVKGQDKPRYVPYPYWGFWGNNPINFGTTYASYPVERVRLGYDGKGALTSGWSIEGVPAKLEASDERPVNSGGGARLSHRFCTRTTVIEPPDPSVTLRARSSSASRNGGSEPDRETGNNRMRSGEDSVLEQNFPQGKKGGGDTDRYST